MSPLDLERLVRIGEGYHLEFKRQISSPVRIAREAIAFANTWGGTILVGVDDDGSIVGVKDVSEELFDLKRALTEHCEPIIPYAFEIVPVSRKRDVIVARIERSDTKPHALLNPESPFSRVVYARVHEHSIAASPEATELMRHENTNQGVQFEFGENELFVLRFLDTYGSIGVDEFARTAGIPAKAASSTLVILARAQVVDLIPSEKGDRFVLNRRSHQSTAGSHV